MSIPGLPEYATLDAWIAAEAIPCSLDSPAACATAVDRLMSGLSPDLELLGFGEALHGGEEILQLRNRLFRRLVEAHGFSAIAVESSFPRGQIANNFVLGRGPATYDEVIETGFSHGFGRLEANRELLAWLRAYNADPAHPVQVHCYGFDQPALAAGPASPRSVLLAALDYLAQPAPGLAEGFRARIEPLLGEDATWENPMRWLDPASAAELLPGLGALRLATEDLILAFNVRRPYLAGETGTDAYLAARHDAVLARHYLGFFAALAGPSGYADALGVRDALMADNLAYILRCERGRGRGRVLAFAHNSHLKRGLAQLQGTPVGGSAAEAWQWWPAGAQIAERLGPGYAVIGTGLGASEANGLAPAEAGTLEARLTAAPGPIRFIPTRGDWGLPPEETVALPPRSLSPRNPSYVEPLSLVSFAQFDAFAVLDSATYSRGGPPLPGEPPRPEAPPPAGAGSSRHGGV